MISGFEVRTSDWGLSNAGIGIFTADLIIDSRDEASKLVYFETGYFEPALAFAAAAFCAFWQSAQMPKMRWL